MAAAVVPPLLGSLLALGSGSRQRRALCRGWRRVANR
jgi:hypothetical protein